LRFPVDKVTVNLALTKQPMQPLRLPARVYPRVLWMARTLAELAGGDGLTSVHYRPRRWTDGASVADVRMFHVRIGMRLGYGLPRRFKAKSPGADRAD
jgi:hypothetical protein